MRNIIVVLCMVLILACTTKPTAPAGIKVISYDALDALLQPQADSLYVINFWSTTCKPCLREMPHFDQLAAQYANKPVRVCLISLDEVADLQTRVQKIITRLGIQHAEVFLANTPHYARWMGKVDANYWGTIPATLIINPKTKYRYFKNAEMTHDELAAKIQAGLK